MIAAEPRGIRRLVSTTLIAAIAFAGLLGCTAPPADLHAGVWRAQLDSPGGPLPFGLELEIDGDRLQATLINGSERIALEHTEYRDRRLLLEMERYDSRIEAELDDSGRRLRGEWSKTSGAGTRSSLAFSAVARGGARFKARGSSPGPEQLRRFDGAHAFLFDAALGDDGRLHGDFWSRDSWHEKWEARRDPDAALPDAFGLAG